MKRTQITDLFAAIRATFVSFFSIIMFVALAVAMFLGIDWSGHALEASGERSFDEGSFHDLEILAPFGMTESDIATLQEIEGVSDVEAGQVSFEIALIDDSPYSVRIASLGTRIDTPLMVEGELPDTEGEIAIEALWARRHNVGVGSTLSLEYYVTDDASEDYNQLRCGDFIVTALMESPAFISNSASTWGASTTGMGSIDVLAWVPLSTFNEKAYQNGSTLVTVRSDALRGLDTLDQSYADGSAALAERVEDLGEKLATARHQELVSDKENQIADAEQKLEDARTEISDGEKALRDAEEELAAREKELADGEAEFNSQYAEYVQQKADGRAELDSGAAQLREAQATYESARAELDKKQSQYAEALAKIDREKAKLDPAVAEYEKARAELDAQQAQYTAALNALDEEESRLETARVEYEAARAELDGRWAEYTASLQQIDEQEAQLDPTADDYEESLAALEAKRQEVLALKPGLDAAETELEATKQWLDEAPAAIEAKRQEVLAQKPALDAAETELADKKAQLDEALATIEAKRQEVLAQKPKLDQAEAELATKKAQLDEGWATYYAGEETYASEVAKAEEQIASGRKELADARAQLEDARKELDEKREKLSDAKAELTEKEADLVSAQNYVEALRGFSSLWSVLTRAQNGGVVSLESFIDITSRLRMSMASLFVLVGLFVCYSAISRLVREQARQIGVKKALGMRASEVTASYLLYAGATVVISAILGVLGAIIVVERIIVPVLTSSFIMKPSVWWSIPFALGFFVMELILILASTWLACHSVLSHNAVDLLAGSEVPQTKERFFERWAVWQNLPLYTQTTVNNLLNDHRRVIGTLVGVAGCTALLVCAITLNDDVIAGIER